MLSWGGGRGEGVVAWARWSIGQGGGERGEKDIRLSSDLHEFRGIESVGARK